MTKGVSQGNIFRPGIDATPLKMRTYFFCNRSFFRGIAILFEIVSPKWGVGRSPNAIKLKNNYTFPMIAWGEEYWEEPQAELCIPFGELICYFTQRICYKKQSNTLKGLHIVAQGSSQYSTPWAVVGIFSNIFP